MQADYVVVGAGSAGCAIAYRLSEAGYSVLVLEHGMSDFGPLIQMPGALAYPSQMPFYDWGFHSEPEPNLGGRRISCPRGKVIGGSSSVNGMVYVRGHAKDYDHWQELGASGWSYADVLPYFKRMECWHDGGHGGDPSWRGKNGPLHITRGPMTNPLFHAFIKAGAEAGYQTTEDYNGQQQEGFGPMEMTVFKGQRWSAANAYLKQALKRPNCALMRCFVRKILIQNGRATGVETEREGEIEKIHANSEVIICASAINSPKLLMLSGIGPAQHLNDHGIDLVANRPGVGQNLQDHLEYYFQMEAIQPVSLFGYWNIFGKAFAGAQWMLTKSGPGASNQFEAAAFIRSKPGLVYPDIQYHFLPLAVNYDGSGAHEGHGFQVHVGPMRSPSRGHVTLSSNDPAEAPKILFNYMSHEEDWIDFRLCTRLTREIFEQPAFNMFKGKEIKPGPRVRSDEEIDEFIKNAVESAYHPCGTCKMGAVDDPMSVVDPECRVIGISGLRVADSSVIPRITNGNLNGPSILIGEKAADHILGKPPLLRDHSEPWINPKWQSANR